MYFMLYQVTISYMESLLFIVHFMLTEAVTLNLLSQTAAIMTNSTLTDVSFTLCISLMTVACSETHPQGLSRWKLTYNGLCCRSFELLPSLKLYLFKFLVKIVFLVFLHFTFAVSNR